MFALDLAKIQFSPITTDEEKIIFAFTRGFTIRKIKEAFHFGTSKVSETIKYYKRTGNVPKSQQREPPKLTSEVLAHIHSMIFADAHITLQKMQKGIAERFQIAVSLTTVARGCATMKYQYKPPKHKQMLTPKQIADRVSFAYTLITMYYSNDIELGSIIFSDESRFVLGDDKRWVWRRRGEYNPTSYKQTEKFPSSVMIYGAIGVNYKSTLVFVDGSIDSMQYQQNIIESGMFESMDTLKGRGNWIFMQDGAPCHTSNDTLVWLGTRCRYITKWPANSPDLNPIENLWGCMKRAVSLINPKTTDELKRVIAELWNDFAQTTINDLVLSFFHRLQLVIIERGESIQRHIRKGMSQQEFVTPQAPETASFIEGLISIISDESGIELPPSPIKDSPFTNEEDQNILQCYIKFNGQWKKISRLIKGRTPEQIKNRYNTVIKKRVAHGKFTFNS